jgi:hypothetical protein
MMKKTYITLLLVSLIITSLFAQEKMDWTDFDYVRNSNAWLSSENAAGLDKLSVEKISFVKAFFNKDDGEFINYFQSDNSYSFGGTTESLYRLKKVVFYGKMDYSNFCGQNMGGSTLLDPYFAPFDIVEYADSTAGEKHNETYHLVGAISVPLRNNLLFGLKADYKTVSYYKVRDLRHTNDLMDLNVTAGFSLPIKDFVSLGLNYYYRRRIENTCYQSEGNTDQQFNSLISYGSFFGTQESFSSEGYTGDDDNNPFVDNIHGVTIQLDLFPESNFHFYNQFGVKWRNGYFGEKSSVGIQYTEHEATIIQYNGVLSYKQVNALHQLSATFEREDLNNYEKAYNESTNDGGNTTIVYYGKNEVLDRALIKASLLYSGNLKVVDNNPEWVVNAVVNFWKRDQMAVFYPYYRKQDVRQVMASASVKRNIIKDDNMFSISLGGMYGSGDGMVKEDGEYASASESYATLDRYLYREFEYFTASRVSGNIGFRYTKAFPQKFRLYGDVKYSYTRAFDTEYIGDSFGHLAISIGYVF